MTTDAHSTPRAQPPLIEGDHVRVTGKGTTLNGVVMFANPSCVVLEVDGALPVGDGDRLLDIVVALLLKEDGYHEVLCDSLVTLERVKPS